MMVLQQGSAAWRLAFGVLALAMSAPSSLGQVLVDLTVEGPTSVSENSYADYTATARFDDDREFEVTLFCEWWVEPQTYASIDRFARLTTGEVPDDHAIVVSASFTWDDVTLEDSIDVTIIDVPDDPEGDPWPEYQRTASRLGRTSTIGPQTATIAWRIQIDFSGFTSALTCSPSLDATGRLYVGTHNTVVCVDTIRREIVWEFPVGDNVLSTPCIWGDRLLFGSTDDFFYCVDKRSGDLIWSQPALPHPNRGQVVDDSLPGGVVYYPSDSDILYARLVEDGTLVWVEPTSGGIVSAPSLDGGGRVIVGGVENEAARAHATTNGETLWVGPAAQHGVGPLPVENGRVYSSEVHSPGPLYCLDASTGEEIWSYEGVGTNNSAIALGHDGTVYIAESWGTGHLIAVSPDGDELWRYLVNAQVKFPPIVDGRGTIYVSSFNSQDGALGVVHAVNPDGTALWVKEMPDRTHASPMLAPDGTLYVVCKDRYLYAFHDPPLQNDLAEETPPIDIRRRPPPP